jgi:hypothetical protein
LRIAIPGRTARHMQAAVHTIWTPRSPSSKEKVECLHHERIGMKTMDFVKVRWSDGLG